MSADLDIAQLRRWIGAEEIADDTVSASLVARFRATIRGSDEPSETDRKAPRLIHFCLCQPAAPMEGLGDDGHPARGGFLPPVPLPRRMWAGSNILFHGDLEIGDTVRRRSTIADVVVKDGRTGKLCFVTVDHIFSVAGEARVTDRQSIVYRALQSVTTALASDAAPIGKVVTQIDPSPPLLFRYSALTFNGHRIHYDAPYATQVEGYPGLVVHGPLQATFLMQLAADIRRRVPDSFEFQSLSTLYDCDQVNLNATEHVDGSMSLWTARADGPVAMRAEARWT
ncbi:FAS1-like dehydratase domain-containing protein [Rhizorhabdus phycosphaerae]|uniref:FAS1-like dehydratase domain-containing protein n=1 Tax=Rhizorhabdus phycosphaerae TaxID=2711156 RepID=UPI0013EBF6CF|nr:MaoC family dehydratase N-terminal domain-containing protein [Rhizorhabdus phycosphaerae]